MIRTFSRHVLTAVLLCAVALSSCNKEEKKETPRAAAPDASPFAATLLGAVPPDTMAFLMFSAQGPAYQKLKASPWGMEQNGLAAMGGMSHLPPSIAGAAPQFLIDPAQSAERQKLFADAVVYLTVGAPASISGGLLFQSDASIKLDEKLPALSAQIDGGKAEVEPLPVASGKGLKIVIGSPEAITEAQPPTSAQATPAPIRHTFYVLWRGAYGVVTNDSAQGEAVLARAAEGKRELPQLVRSAEFSKLAGTLPPAAERIYTAYADLSRLGDLSPEAKQRLANAGVAPRQMVFVSTMTDKPEFLTKVVLEPQGAQNGEMLARIGSSTPEGLLRLAPSDALLFLSVQGETLRQLAQAFTGPAMLQAGPWSSVQSVNRVAVMLRVAPVGQSLLPLPDFIVAIDSSDSKSVLDQLTAGIGASTAGAPGAAGWKSKKIQDQDVSVLSGGFGMPLAATNVGNLTIVGSNEMVLKDGLGRLQQKDSAFVAQLPASAKTLVAAPRSVINLTVDFVKLSALLDNMKGLLGMYAGAAAAQAGNDAAAPKAPDLNPTIEVLRKAGSLFVSITMEQNTLTTQMFYEPVAATH